MDIDRSGSSGNDKLRIKNKLPAPVQITAEQLLREASERLGGEHGRKRFHIDAGPLSEYRLRERTKHEEAVRRSRSHIHLYIKYAKFEEEQGDLPRARSVYERAIAQDPRHHALWLRYGEMEMRGGNIQLARNVWDRATTILPRHDQFWYKRVTMEEAMNELDMARQVFSRWMRWEPDLNAWKSFVKFELRHHNHSKARMVFEQMLLQYYADPAVWLDYVRFEERDAMDTVPELECTLKDIRVMRARAVFERSLHCIQSDHPASQSHLIEFAKFEGRNAEIERARAIYLFALQQFPDSDTLRYSYVAFEKQFGDTSRIGEIVLEKRRKQYERRVELQPFDYDGWFDLLRLEEEFYLIDHAHLDRVRDAYERAISKVPQSNEKRHWRRYIYIWLFYAVFEHDIVGVPERAVEILKLCLKLIPHAAFTFSKVWVAMANVYVGLGDFKSARLTFGQAIGQCPKSRLFKSYIELELELREFDRCRIIYEKWLEFDSQTATVWIKYAELERALEEEERVRALYELALEVENLDIPELVWKAYIDWEVDMSRFDHARALYERLLKKTQHFKVYLSYANMELLDGAANDVDENTSTTKMRNVLKRAYERFAGDDDDSRLQLVQSWHEIETSLGNLEFAENMKDLYFPKENLDDHGQTMLVWPEHKNQNAQTLLALAKKWKQLDK